jgi:hypothetical protein
MSRITSFMVIGIIAGLAGPGKAAAAKDPAEDDLAVVRRAVAQEPASARPEALPASSRKPSAAKAEPQWLRVRIKEKSGRSTVSVNLPLALARALGADIPLDLACRHKGDKDRSDKDRRKIRLGDVLESLDAGQDIVHVDSDDASVRVWVE